MSALALFLFLSSPTPELSEPESARALQRGIAAFQAADYAAARPLLETARRAFPDEPEVALLLGITYYRLSQLDEAEPLLDAALKSDDAETRDSARIFLGLIANARGNTDQAQALLSEAARSGNDLARAANSLRGAIGGRLLTLFAMLRGEFDSNVPFVSSEAISASPDAARSAMDGSAFGLVYGALRPVPSVGFVLQNVTSYRQQFQLQPFNLFANTLSARYLFLGKNDRPGVSAGFESMLLGWRPFLLGLVADAGYRRNLWRELGIAARYRFRYRRYYATGYTAYTGHTHMGSAELSWGTVERPLEIAASYQLLGELTADTAFSALGHGALLYVRGRMGVVELTGSAQLVWRNFFAPSEDAQVAMDPLPRRTDAQLVVDATATFAVTSFMGIVAGASLLYNRSNQPAYNATKIIAHTGVYFILTGP